jgi:hypothetical protein
MLQLSQHAITFKVGTSKVSVGIFAGLHSQSKTKKKPAGAGFFTL